MQRRLSTLKQSVTCLIWSGLIFLIILPVPSLLLFAPTRAYLDIRADSALQHLGPDLVALSFAIALITLWAQSHLRRLRTLLVS